MKKIKGTKCIRDWNFANKVDTLKKWKTHIHNKGDKMNVKKTKLLYLYSLNIDNEKVTINQSLNTVSSMNKFEKTEYLIPWISQKKLQRILKRFAIPQGINFMRLPFFQVIKKLEIFNQAIYATFASIYILIKKPRTIYTRDFSTIYFFSFIPQILHNKKLVFESHKIFHKVSKKVNYEMEKRAYKIVNSFVSTSEKCKQDLEKLFDISSKNIVVAPNAVNLKQFQMIKKNKKKYDLNEDRTIIVYSGSFLWWKGIPDLIKSIKFVESKKVKFLLIGGEGKELKKIQEMAKKEGINDKIIFTGHISQKEVAQLLNTSDIAVVPNNKSKEGTDYTSPIKIYEYLASGLPIISSDLNSLKSILVEKENALFFKPEDSFDLAKKIDELIVNKKLRKTMSKNNIIKSKNLSWNNRAKKILTFLELNDSEKK